MYLADIVASHQRKKIYLVLVFLIISVPAATRYDVGNDYLAYLKLSEYFQSFSSIIAAKAVHDVEYSFIIMSFVFKNAPMLIFATYALLTQFFIIKGIWYHREYISPSLFLFIYLMSFYLRTYNIFRQSLAIAIVFFAIKYIKEKKLAKYILFVCIATLFHKTAFVSIILYYWLQPSKAMSTAKKVLMYTWPIFVLLLSDGLINKVYSIIPFFKSYASTYQLVAGESIFTIGSLLQTFIYVLYLYNRKKIRNGKDEFTMSLLDKSMLAQIFFHFASYKLDHAARIGLYFNFSFYLGLASFHKKGKKILIKKMTRNELFLIVYSIYQFSVILISNRFNSLPFKIWL